MENKLEDLIQEICSDDFEYIIKKRGEDYYDCNKVLSCYKSSNKYYAKVLGSNSTNYNVEIELDEIEPKYSCTCPCDFNCKHEYAVLLAIQNRNYQEIKGALEAKYNLHVKTQDADETKGYKPGQIVSVDKEKGTKLTEFSRYISNPSCVQLKELKPFLPHIGSNKVKVINNPQ